MTWPIGAPLKRTEDRRLLTGRGRYVDDLRVPGLLHAAIARSAHAHARIDRIDGDAARRMAGVVAVLTLADLPIPGLDVAALDHPSAVNELEIKGVGESGAISPTAAVANAIEDALADRGVEITRAPLPPARVWQALRDAGPPPAV